MESKRKVIKTNEEFKVISDPYRMKILSVVAGSEEGMTVKMIATELNEVPAKVHYHVKKLIAADILMLDHTEEINGITAKYYIAKYTDFEIGIDEAQNDKMKKIQIDNVTKLLVDQIDSFKEDVINRANKVKQLEPKEKSHDGFFSTPTLYMTKEDMISFQKDYTELVKKYAKKDTEKDKYSALFGIITKQ